MCAKAIAATSVSFTGAQSQSRDMFSAGAGGPTAMVIGWGRGTDVLLTHSTETMTLLVLIPRWRSTPSRVPS